MSSFWHHSKRVIFSYKPALWIHIRNVAEVLHGLCFGNGNARNVPHHRFRLLKMHNPRLNAGADKRTPAQLQVSSLFACFISAGSCFVFRLWLSDCQVLMLLLSLMFSLGTACVSIVLLEARRRAHVFLASNVIPVGNTTPKQLTDISFKRGTVGDSSRELSSKAPW